MNLVEDSPSDNICSQEPAKDCDFSEKLKEKIFQLQNQLEQSNEKFLSLEKKSNNEIKCLESELRLRVDFLKKESEESKKEKESMVLKFAQAEMKNIEFQKKVQDFEMKLKELAKENQQFVMRTKNVISDRDRLQHQLDSKKNDFVTFEKEINTFKENSLIMEQRFKQSQARFYEEQSAHNFTKKSLDQANLHIKTLSEDSELIKKSFMDIVNFYNDELNFQNSEESNNQDQIINKLKNIITFINENRSQTIEKDSTISHLTKELESFKKSSCHLTSELKNLKDKCAHQEVDRLCKEELINNSREKLKVLSNENANLSDRLKTMESIEVELNSLKTKYDNLCINYEEIKESKNEADQDIEGFRHKETELLEFIQRITDSSASTQSENIQLQSQLCESIEFANQEQKKFQQLNEKSEMLRSNFSKNQNDWQKQKNELESQVLTHHEKCLELEALLNQERADARINNKKQQNTIKELMRELNKLQRQLSDTSLINSPNINHDPIEKRLQKQLSKADFIHCSFEPIQTSYFDVNELSLPESPIINNNIIIHNEKNSPNKVLSPEFSTNYLEIADNDAVKIVHADRQMLIEKIISLQRQKARLCEKIDFYKEHCRQLTDSIAQKNKLIQSYILREESGSISSNEFDKNRKMISLKSGIMASVYSSQPADNKMNLELSLEINKKLQQVLEDTLLKNIILKENINTLGEEIAYLKRDNSNQLSTCLK